MEKNRPPKDRDAARLETRSLAVQRGDRLLFRKLSLTLEAGQAIFVVGPNGAGKTTLLRTLCGLSQPAAGIVQWCGQDIASLGEEFRKRLLYVGHRSGNKGELSCDANLQVNLGLADRQTTREERRAALAEVGLRGLEHLPARFLSQGQQRRLSLARLMLTRAMLWVLDEPFNALDAQAMRWLTARMEAHLAAGGLAVFTSHYEVPLRGGLSRLDLGAL
ncbi:MAG: cytochrome c biogenesis heme-transporting ATPase CcmA [Thiohalomonadaceae bacterium]